MAERHLIWGEARPLPRAAQVAAELRQLRDVARAGKQRMASARVLVHDDRRTRSIAALAVGWLVTEGVVVSVTYSGVGAHLEIAISLEAA